MSLFASGKKCRDAGSEMGLPPVADPAVDHAASLYLDLLKRCLTRVLFPDERLHKDLITTSPFDPAMRDDGRDWPTLAETMVGLRRLNNLQLSVEEVLRSAVPGDLVETGVWRGGAAILMRGVLQAYRVTDRRIWLVDSFQGLPEPDADKYPSDAGRALHKYNPYLGVSLEAVRENFRRYELLDDQVSFLPGWFRDTLPTAPIGRIAVLRLDGDLYESTMEVLMNLYDRVSIGGYVIIDDYGALPCCRTAVTDFRERRGVSAPLHTIDWTGVFWRKQD